MTSFRKSLAINFASSSGATVVMFIVSIIVARILTPAEIGIYSIAIVLVNIAHVFREFGVGSYLQRAESLTADKVRSAIGVAYAIALGVAALLFFGSDLVAAWFGHREIAGVMQILSLSFLFIPFSSVALALLLREYDATKISIGTAAGTTAYTIVSIGLALAGWGAASLAWANLANVLATGVVYVWLAPKHMAYLPRFREAGDIVRFGAGALFTNLVKAGNAALPDLILGKLGSARQVGLLSRANSTVNIFMYVAGSAITFGSQTYLSKAHHAKQSLAPLLHRAIALVTAVGWPMLAVTAVAAEDVIVGLYGDQWVDAAPAILPLALMAAIDLTFHYKVPAFNAIGRPYLSSIPLLVTGAARIGLGVMLFTGDIVSFSWALMLATLATAPVWLILQRRYLGTDVLPFLAMLLPSALVAGLCAAIAFATLSLVRMAGVDLPLLRLAIIGVPTTLVWLAALRLLSHPLFDEILLFAGKLGLRPSHNPTQAEAG
ncbi:oligosaccharide flippase family protein [Alteriqipengyuania lutimaris]|uniref:oligosaccharide flippase family protein n=1 Tax=Alteriqipengyuania lutimaris TaxID=1538146 RepID=UPI0015F19516|nr:oligosaccharide flippase family protein [Alteriqipengyuania lutimaris]MBB3033623.1 O-antigen/teichoic acid export membrane protein [Alteriqipengyuania lutimaris]